MFSSKTIRLAIRLKRAPAGVRDLRLLRNGLLIKRWHGDIPLSADPITVEVRVSPRENRFTAYAFNQDNVKGPDTTFLYEAAFPQPRETATIVAFGVTKYQARTGLFYAASDATTFASDLKNALEQTGYWDDVRAVPLTNEQVTRQTILKAIRLLAGDESSTATGPLAAIRRTGPSDTIFLFFAGHGEAIQDRFYLIPFEVGVTRGEILKAAISDEDLESALESVDARNIVIVIDSCYSGQALESEDPRYGPLNVPGLAHLAYEKGMYVLVATQPDQQAGEASSLGHGLLTSVLVKEGLGKRAPEADTDPKDGVVDLTEWLEHAVLRVPEIAAEVVVGAERGVLKTETSTENTNQSAPQRPRLYFRKDLRREVPPIVNLNSSRWRHGNQE
jgi:hypothetical protein